MTGRALMTLLLLLFGVGVLGFYDDRATTARIWRGLATMALSLIGIVILLFDQGQL